jgi:hypothetical protein
MALTVQEKYRGRTRSTGRNASAEIAYIIQGDEGETDDQAEAAVLEEAPATYAGLTLEGIGLLEEIHVTDDDPTPTWEATVRYVREEFAPREPGDSRVSFRTTGGTAHITHSKATRATYTLPFDDKIDFKKAIGMDWQGGVAGTDVYVPIFEWQESHIFSNGQITPAFLSTLYLMTGATNETTWRVFQPEDCLFMGVDGRQLEDTNWELNFYFAAQMTEEIASIGGITAEELGPIVKRGWQHLWVYMAPADVTLVDSAQEMFMPVPRQVNVEQIYYVDDFVNLGLGT